MWWTAGVFLGMLSALGVTVDDMVAWRSTASSMMRFEDISGIQNQWIVKLVGQFQYALSVCFDSEIQVAMKE
jgi:hypothetical protein